MNLIYCKGKYMNIIDKKYMEKLDIVLIYHNSHNVTKSIQKFNNYIIKNNKKVVLVQDIFELSRYFVLYNHVLLIIPIGANNTRNNYEINFILNGFYLFNKSSSIILWDISEINYNKSIQEKYSRFLINLLKNSYISIKNKCIVNKILYDISCLEKNMEKVVMYIDNLLYIEFYSINCFIEECINLKEGIHQFPGGEFTIIPAKNTVNGYFIYKGFKYNIKNNFVVNYNDNLLIEEIKNNPICEIGIGLNSKIPRINYLPCLEKAIGTIHLGFGSNFDLGGDYLSDIHFDLILNYDNTIYLNGKGYDIY